MDEYYCAFNTELINKAIRSQLRKLTVNVEATGYGDWLEFENLYKGENKLRTFILEGVHIKKKRQWKLKHSNLEIGDRVVLDNIDWRIIKILDEKKRPKNPKVVKGVVFSEFTVPYILPEYMKGITELVGDTGSGYIQFSHSRQGKNFMYRMVKDMEEKKKLKEFHKRPYFKTTVETVKGKPLGQENLKKVKFPCWCSYLSTVNGVENVGQLNKCGGQYNLYYVGKQGGTNFIDGAYTLRKLIEVYKIEILKGELKLWREVAK